MSVGSTRWKNYSAVPMHHFFWQAIQIRYPEYVTYNRKLYALFGGAD